MKTDKTTMKKTNNYYIVRADRAGVFFGQIKEKTTTSVIMQNVRKLFYWDGAAGVEQIAQDGVNDNSKLTVIIPEMEIDKWMLVWKDQMNGIGNIGKYLRS